MKGKLLTLLLLGLISLSLILPFLRSGYFPTQDGEWAVVRLAEMHREIKDLQIPPRWAGYLNHGYGYPLFLFTYPLPYYLGEVLHLAGFGLVTSIKIVFIISILGSAVSMWLLGSQLWGKWGGLISTALYLYAPYRLTNLYFRGSIGESLTLILFPLLFWVTYKLIQKPNRGLIIISAVTFAALILTHNATAILFTPVLICWAVFWLFKQPAKKINYWSLLIASGLGVILCAYFWLPALFEKKYIALSVIPLADKTANFLIPFQLLFTYQNGAQPPLGVGWLLLVAAILGLISPQVFKSKKYPSQLPLFLGGISLLAILLLFPISRPVWQLPLLKEIDFPWRMLTVVSFLLPLCAGAIAGQKFGKMAALIIFVLALIFGLPQIRTQPQKHLTDNYYATNDATTTSADELMPIWVIDKPRNRPQNKVEIYPQVEYIVPPIAEGSVWKLLHEDSRSLELLVNSHQPLIAQVNTLFFPGWSLKIDNRKAEISEGTELISFEIPAGQHQVSLYFARTPVRLVADILSGIGVTLIALLWIFSKKSYR